MYVFLFPLEVASQFVSYTVTHIPLKISYLIVLAS